MQPFPKHRLPLDRSALFSARKLSTSPLPDSHLPVGTSQMKRMAFAIQIRDLRSHLCSLYLTTLRGFGPSMLSELNIIMFNNRQKFIERKYYSPPTRKSTPSLSAFVDSINPALTQIQPKAIMIPAKNLDSVLTPAAEHK